MGGGVNVANVTVNVHGAAYHMEDPSCCQQAGAVWRVHGGTAAVRGQGGTYQRRERVNGAPVELHPTDAWPTLGPLVRVGEA
jgi:hypothetical protein